MKSSYFCFYSFPCSSHCAADLRLYSSGIKIRFCNILIFLSKDKTPRFCIYGKIKFDNILIFPSLGKIRFHNVSYLSWYSKYSVNWISRFQNIQNSSFIKPGKQVCCFVSVDWWHKLWSIGRNKHILIGQA